MKKYLNKIRKNDLNNSLYFVNKILKFLFVFILLLILYFTNLIFKTFNIYKIIFNILKLISPLFIGIILAYSLNPLINILNKKINRKLAIFIVYIILMSILTFICFITFPILIKQINEIIKSYPSIIKKINNFINNITHNNFNININKLINEYTKNNLFNKLSDILNIASDILKIFSCILLGIIISIYLLIDFEKIKTYIKKKIKKKKMLVLLKQIDETIFSYIKANFFIFIIVFILTLLIFIIIKLKNSIFFAFLNAFTNLIPYIGPYIGGAITVLYAFSINKKIGILVLIFLLIIQILESYIFHPFIMSKSINLHPITILISLLIFGYFFGIIGMVVVMPLISILKLIYKYIKKEV